MYQNITNQNPMLSQFNTYMAQNPVYVPFQNNNLINNNVHVRNNLNSYIQDNRMMQRNMPQNQSQLASNYNMQQNNGIMQPNNTNCQANQQPYHSNPQLNPQLNPQFNPQLNQQQNNQQTYHINSKNITQPFCNSTNQLNALPVVQPMNNNRKVKNINIIEEMLKPIKINAKDKEKGINKDVCYNYKNREKVQVDTMKKKIHYKLSNVGYKSIIKDKPITKNVDDVEVDDFIVHKIEDGVDDDKYKFNAEHQHKINENEKINDELEIQFHIDNYDTNKKKFEYKQTYIRNLRFDENTLEQNKEDYVEFYSKRQQEAEEGIKLCDEVLNSLSKSGVINQSEVSLETSDDNKNDIMNIDLSTLANTINVSEITNNGDNITPVNKLSAHKKIKGKR